MDANLAVLLVWWGGTIIGFIKPIAFLSFAVPFIFYFLEKDSQLVKQHALQAIGLFLIMLGISILMWIIPFLLLLYWVPAIISLAFSILASLKGYNYEEYEVPMIQPLVQSVKKILGS
jgi:uncharacterized membrane protein